MTARRPSLAVLASFALSLLWLAACDSGEGDDGGLTDVAAADVRGDAPSLPEDTGGEPPRDAGRKDVTAPPDVPVVRDVPVAPDVPGLDAAGPDVPGADVVPPECDSDDDCDDGEACTSDVCGPDRACVHTPVAGWCHIDGGCFEAGAVDPDNPCQACLPLADAGAWTPDDTLTCAPDDLCARWSCRGGACVAQPVLDCDDGLPCTDDRCEGDVGCVHDPLDIPCDDGDRCTRGDRCAGGVCVPGTELLPCDDGEPCTADTCDPARGCVYTPATGGCDDGDVCTTDDRCQAGACAGTPVDADLCDDGDPCTDDWCHPLHGCLHRDNTAPCDDGDPCTEGDRCVGRVCVGGAALAPCDDGNPCTDDTCVPGAGCQSTPNTAPCDDDDVCTTGDVCAEGACTSTGTLDCSDSDPCTAEGCDPQSGCWTEAISGAACDDGRVCTVDEVCTDGACVGTPLACDDGNDCTADRCVEPLGCRSEILGTPECGLVVVVTTPERGVTLDAAALEAGAVPVRGYVVSPADPAPTLTLNGQALTLTALPAEPNRFAFDTAVAPEHAMNLLRLRAADAFGREAERVQSFYYSTVYYPVTADDFARSRIPAGVGVGLSQEFVDDNEASVDDLASLVDLIIGSLDIGALIPSPASRLSELGCTYDIYVTSATFSGTRTDLRITEDGLALALALRNLDIRFRLQRVSGGFWCPGNQTGSATATEARVNTRVRIAAADGVVSAVLDPTATTAQLVGLNVSIDSWFLDLLIGFFEGTIQTLLEDQLEAAIRDQVEPLLATVFDALLLDVDIPIPSLFPGGQPALVSLRTRIGGMRFAADQFMDVEMDAAVLAPHGVPYTRLGSLGYANCLGAPFGRNLVDFAPHSRINLGLFDDVANQILHAAWETGAFELTLGPEVIPVDQLAQFGVADLDVQVSLLLPPVLTSCKQSTSPDAPPDAIVLELGDLQVTASLTLSGQPVDLLLYASLTGAATLGTTTSDTGATAIGIQILGFDSVETDLVSVEAPDATTAALVGTLIDQALVPMLLEQISMDEPIGFELPVIDLSNPEAGIPAGTALAILPEQVLRSANANTIVKGRVVQATP